MRSTDRAAAAHPGPARFRPGSRRSAAPAGPERGGFSLNAAVACRANERRKLERLCRYVARPAIALQRLSRDGDGLVVYELKHPFRDGTTHVCCTWMYECRGRRAGIAPAIFLHFRHPWRSDAGSGLFEPLDFMARLAALVPRPRCHLVRYHGLLAPKRTPQPPRPAAPPRACARRRRDHRGANPRRHELGATRSARVFAIEISRCPRCGGQLRVRATITDPRVIAAILAHLESRAARFLPPTRH